MKLHELDAQRQTDKISKTLQSHYGTTVDFSRLSETQARAMLSKVKALLGEHKRSVSRHFSERNPDYMKLVMLEQALTNHVPQSFVPAKSIMESELQQAQVVMAAQDMVDQIQGIMEDVSEMQFKDLPALTDAVKNDMGADTAAQFQTQAAAALTNLLAAVQAAKTEMESAQGVLTGQAPVVPGQEPALPAAGEEELDLDLDTEVPAEEPEEESEEEISVADLGRERR